jgi:uncharacterized protein (DUF1800 family)
MAACTAMTALTVTTREGARRRSADWARLLPSGREWAILDTLMLLAYEVRVACLAPAVHRAEAAMLVPTANIRVPRSRLAAAVLFAAAVATTASQPAHARIPAADFNGDGKDDLVWRNATTGASFLWMQNGLATTLSAPLGGDTNYSIVGAGDFDGDGRADLLWRSAATGSTSIWLMNGGSVVAAAGVGGSTDWAVIAVGDFDGDKKSDLVWRNNKTGITSVWLMNGTAPASTAIVGGSILWTVVGVADIDSDGHSDLIWRNAQTGDTVAWLMNGTASTSQRFLGGNAEWEFVDAGDFDGNGTTDLVWRSQFTGTTVLWKMNGTVVTSAALLGGDIHWQLIGSGDFNGDRTRDLGWRDAKSGTTIVQLLAGGTAVAAGAVGGDSVWFMPEVGQNPGRLSPLDYLNRDASRLALQATFGATRTTIDTMRNLGPSAWITQQFGAPQTMHMTTILADPDRIDKGWSVMAPSIWKQYFEGQDQLRQRMVFALSQILVVSMNNNALLDNPCGMASYVDMLGTQTFGNFRDVLRLTTLSTAMGHYLDMKGAAKADPVSGSIPSENYAREMLQLFSIGTVQLNLDGSAKLDAGGKPIATYDEPTVQEFARALSGWHFGGQDQTKTWRWLYPDTWDPDPTIAANKSCNAWSRPMEPWLAAYRSADNTRDVPGPAHDTGAKTLLNGMQVPAGRTAGQDLESVIDSVFLHPNVGPFIGRRLIQRLVTSNPSPAYVARVAGAFNDNGANIRGDMKAVIRAILLDPEARSQLTARSPVFGKLREPVLNFVQLHRAFNGVMTNGSYKSIWNLSGDDNLNQAPLFAPSVFNFYHPDYGPPGVIADNAYFAPEFEITTSSSLTGFADFSKWAVIGGFGQYETDSGKRIVPDYSAYLPLATSDPAAMVDQLNLVLMGGSMSAQFRAQLLTSIGKVTAWPVNDVAGQRLERFKMALWLIINSPEYMIQK